MTALAERAQEYLTLRRALGTKLTEAGPVLASFTDYLQARGEHVVTINAVIAWATADPEASRHRIARRISMVRGFASYLHAFDPATQIPPTHLLACGPTRTAPHIYTDTEIDALFAAAGQMQPELHAKALQTLIGLMASTGLRTGEVLRLDRSDFDPTAGTLTIVKSKWGKSRRIPLHPSTTQALLDYSALRDRLLPHPSDPALLLHRRGTRIASSTLQPWFAHARTTAEIPCRAGHRRPRAYDLRHTFAVHTLRDWHLAGLDVRQQLPVLSSYLGHVNPDNTYWYLQAVPELMTVLADRLTHYLDGTDEDLDTNEGGGRT